MENNKKALSKIKSWWHNLFHKSEEKKEIIQNDETVVKVKEQKLTFLEEQRQKMERRQYLLQLQRKYENKELLEKDMNLEDKTDLENLYVEQINELQRKLHSGTSLKSAK